MGLISTFVRLFRDETPSIEQWSERTAPVATPDDLLAAACIESFAKDFDQWARSGGEVAKAVFSHHIKWVSSAHLGNPRLVNRKRGITLEFLWGAYRPVNTREEKRMCRKAHPHVSFNCSYYMNELKGCTLNSIMLSPEVTARIIDAWVAAADAYKTAEEAKAKALAEMQANEAKWDLVEGLFNMRRLPNGALVPASTCQPANPGAVRLPNCIVCGEPFPKARAKLTDENGQHYRTCLKHGAAQRNFPVIPMTKSNYVCGSVEDLKQSYGAKGPRV